MGFGYPRAERDGLVQAAPDTFFLPPAGDLRYQWVCARLARLDDQEMRELVIDAWRMCVPRMLHDLPDLPAPTAAAWSAADAGSWPDLTRLLAPEISWIDGRTELRGRDTVLRHLRAHPRPRPPRQVEVRAGQLVRWVR